MLIRILLASVVLFALWLLLSGHYGALLLTLGALSCVFVAWLSEKLGLFKNNFSTLKFNLKLPIFLPWFFIEIIKSNLDVCWRILHPKLPIDPKFTRVDATQHSDMGRAVYANCITLTPGTYSLDIDAESIEVHSLTAQLADDLQQGNMSKRLTALENKTESKN
jgi:Multisubunit Na+/H+ antiporter, MnhE subunit